MSGAREQGLIPNTSTRCARRSDDCERFWAQSERCSIPGGSAGIRAELDWLGTLLGDLRDLDVFRQHLRAELSSLKSAGRAEGRALLDRLDAERARARVNLHAALDGPRYLQLLDRLDNAVEYPRVVTAKLSLPAIAAGQFRKLRKAVKALPETPSNDDLHAVRIKVKRARYAAELAQTLVGRPAKQFVARAKKVQDILGEHQDAAVAEGRLRALVGRDGGRPERFARPEARHPAAGPSSRGPDGLLRAVAEAQAPRRQGLDDGMSVQGQESTPAHT